MPASGNYLTPRTRYSESTANTSGSALLLDPGSAPELEAIDSKSVPDVRSAEDRQRKYCKNIFAEQKWHKPYADALLQGDAARTPGAIDVAERAIFTHFLELAATSERTDESIDMQNAIDALSQLKKDIAIANLTGFRRVAVPGNMAETSEGQLQTVQVRNRRGFTFWIMRLHVGAR
jgi:hypothetical protein